jgi:hypothetical protein
MAAERQLHIRVKLKRPGVNEIHLESVNVKIIHLLMTIQSLNHLTRVETSSTKVQTLS